MACLLKMVKGETPYDQAAVNAALTALEADVAKNPDRVSRNPKV